MTLRNSTSALLFTVTTALAACGPTPATTEGVMKNVIVAPEDRPEYRTYDNWGQQSRFSTPYNVYQNVDYDEIDDLLVGNTVVGYFEYPGGSEYGGLIVYHYTSDRAHRCFNNGRGDISYENLLWRPVLVPSLRRLLQWPMVTYIEDGGDWQEPQDHDNFQYRAETGELSILISWQGKRWDGEKGHIQRGIPAAVYDVCPDFPSASSLGVPLITTQTSTNYFELVEQDPGNRIMRPELVTEYTARHWWPDEWDQ